MTSALVWLAAAASALAVWWWVPTAPLGRLGSRPSTSWRTLWVGARDRVRTRWPDRAARERAATLRASVPQVCDLLAVCLDAGRPPRSALRVVVGVLDDPVAGELAGVLRRIDLGVDEAEAWLGLRAVPGYASVARDLARSVQRGLGLAALLRQHAVDARKDAAAEALVRARGAGVRSVVPLMLCFLPAFLLLGVVPIFGAMAAALVP